MKKIMFVISLSLISLLTYSQGKTPPEWPAASSIGSADLFLLWQSGALKNLPYSYLGGVLNDTADVLRAEFPPLWRGDIHDTATVLRGEIADVGTADTAWSRTAPNVTRLKYIGDSVGVGTVTPTEKLHVIGTVKATAADFDNGYDNVLIGEDVGLNLTSSGNDNVFIGTKAGEDATSADYNTAIGYWAGLNLTIGANNFLAGYKAGAGLTEGTNNTFIGSNAGQSVTTGEFNVMIGPGSGLLSSSSSSNNVWLGYRAGLEADISNAILIGYDAGYNLDEAGGIIIGHQAGDAATSSVGLTTTGYQSYSALTTSDYHTGYGYQVGDAITTGSAGSSLFGHKAGTAMTTADGTSLYGYNAGLSITTGDNNSFFGYTVGDAVTTGNSNSLFGLHAGGIITTGSFNTAFGASALGSSAIANESNTAIGAGAGYDNTGDSSVFVGRNAGYSNTASNVLFIDNSNDATPLIWGDFSTDSIIINGDFRVTGYAGGATAWTDESDRRLKKNITPIKNPLQKVLDLEGVQFEWKDAREPGQRIGLIAQDVEKVLPEVVKSGETYGIQYGPIVALLIEAVKEQQKEIDELKSQLKLKKTKNVKHK